MQLNRILLIALLGSVALGMQGCGGDKKDTPKIDDKSKKVGPATKDADKKDVTPEPHAVHEPERTKADFFDGESFKWDLIEKLATKYPANRALKHMVLNKKKVQALPADKQDHVYNIVKSGFLLADDSSVGVYAQMSNDYYEYDWLLQNIMFDYQKASPDAIHTEDWKLDQGVNTMVGDGSKTYSLRIRVARNPVGEPLPASCKEEDFLRIEKNVSDVLETMILPVFKTKFDQAKLTTTIYTLTKDHPKAGKKIKTGGCPKFWYGECRETEYVFVDYNEEGQKAYKEYQKMGIFSGDPTSDPALSVGDINNAFPQGRATWNLSDGTTTIRIYINEEDTLRIQMLTNGNDVGNLFTDMKAFLDAFEKALVKKDKKLGFAKDPKLGYLASCPSNVGTGMRASGQMLIPTLLSAEGYDINDNSEENQKKGAEVLGKMSDSDAFKSNDLQLRGGLGEYTAPGKGGKIDLSYKKRTFVTEKQIIMKLIEAMQYTESLEVAAGQPKVTKSLRKGNSQRKLTA